MTLYRAVELTPGVRLEPAPSGRRALLVVDVTVVTAHRGQARVELDETALERAVEAAREALE